MQTLEIGQENAKFQEVNYSDKDWKAKTSITSAPAFVANDQFWSFPS